MCRLLGIVASEPTNFRFALHEAPRSLAWLSREHPHGWGVAVYETGAGWTVDKEPACAGDDARFHDVAMVHRGEVLVAHVRLRTVGEMILANTHPFRRKHWLFAHNGTIVDTDFLRANASPARLSEVEGHTDSELFFAFLLTRIDAATTTMTAATTADVRAAGDAALVAAVREVQARPDFGACNFLLSDGDAMYAHRSGRTLYLLERHPRDAVVRTRTSHETGAVVETPWSPHRDGVLIASERMTDEPWCPIADGTLMRVDRLPTPAWRVLTGDGVGPAE